MFISYARRDGKEYALKLRDQLKALDFSCFLDYDELPAGNSLNKTLKKAIRKSAILVVVGTERAIKSRYVELEIAEFSKTTRAIIPIDIAGTLADPPWNVIKERDIVWIDEAAESLVKGVPSPNVADSIDKLFKYTRRNTRVRGQVFATVSLFLIGAALAIFLIQGKVKALNVANVAMQVQQQELEKATADAKQQERNALAATDEANRQKAEALLQKKAAAQFAATAEAKAREALASARRAETEAERAEEQERYSSARRLYVDSRNTLDNTGKGLELSALLSVESLKTAWIQDAYETWAQAMDKLPSRADDVRMELEGTSYAVAFSPDGKLLAIGGDRVLALCKTSDGKKVNQLAFDDAVRAVCFSPDGRWIAAGSGHKAWVLDSKTLAEITTFPVFPETVRRLIFSPDGYYLAVATEHEKAQVFETQSWKEIMAPELEGGGRILSITFGYRVGSFGRFKNLVIVGGVGKLGLWNIMSGKQIGSRLITGIAWDVASNVNTNNARSSVLASAGDNGRVELWTLNDVSIEKDYELRMPGGSTVRAVAFSPDGGYLAAAGTDGTARVWQLEGKLERTRKVFSGEVNALAFSPDGRWIATGTDGETRVWKARHGKELRRLEHDDEVQASAFSPDGNQLATASADGVIRTFNTTTWNETRKIKSTSQARSLLFSTDGRRLVAEAAGRVDVYDATTLEKGAYTVFEENPQTARQPAIGFSPDGQWLAATHQSVVRLLSTPSQQWTPPIQHKGSISRVAVSPDGKYVLTRTAHRRQRAVLLRPTMDRVWETSTGKEVAWRSLEDEDNKVLASRPPVESRSEEDDFPLEKEGGPSALLSIVDTWKEVGLKKEDEVASLDGLWKAEKVGQIIKLKEASHDETLSELVHDGDVLDLAFSPDSRWLITASADHTARVWPLRPNDMIDEACARLTRNLKQEEEWKQYMRGKPFRKTCPNLP